MTDIYSFLSHYGVMGMKWGYPILNQQQLKPHILDGMVQIKSLGGE